MSTISLVQTSITKILHTNYGRISMQFSEPLSLKDYLNQKQINKESNKDQRMKITKHLTFDIIDKFHKELVCMSTSLIASLILVHRFGIAKDTLIDKFEWLNKQIINRGSRLDSLVCFFFSFFFSFFYYILYYFLILILNLFYLFLISLFFIYLYFFIYFLIKYIIFYYFI